MNPQEQLSIGDFVKHLAARLHKEGVELPLADLQHWQLVFYSLKRAQDIREKPAFLEHLGFDWDGPFPKSPELTEVLQGLHWTGGVSAFNPQFQRIALPADVANLWLSREEGLDESTLEFLSAAVDRAKQEFSVSAQPE